MKLKYTLEATELDDEIICVPVGVSAETTGGVLKLNSSGYEIVKLFEIDTEIPAVAEFLSEKYEINKDRMMDYVQQVVDTLAAYGMIEK